ncbi:MAG TPA: DoxX family protein [Amycolatopsis sp.]|uniref:DoxX family protein n=1 Tax=Amycolatopsis sp. TaxID=37632 RepID=UPI002B47911F|nr:DoxX family protein [Amycolatopsis sp.]HKS48265.1 DoxX family protein [Amycolatopsis sp.]
MTDTSTPTTTRASLNGTVLAAVRMVVSFLFATHGAQGLFGAFGGIDGNGTAVPPGSWPAWWASVLELAGGVLVFFGLATRPAAIVCSGVMAYAYFTVHQPVGLLPLQNMGEPAALFCWIFLLIAVLGPGRYSLDAVIRKRRGRAPRAEQIRVG